MQNKLNTDSTITSEDMFLIDKMLSDYHNLSNAVEVILGMPENIGIANNLYNHEQCTTTQKKHNLLFLEDAKIASMQYVRENFKVDTPYFLNNIDNFSTKYEDSGFAGNKEEYALNQYISELFSKIAISLNEVLSNTSLFNHILSKYSSSESKRLSLKFLEVFRIYAFKELSFIAYYTEAFNIALMYHDYAMQLYFSSSKSIFYDSADYFRKISSIQGTKAAKTRWADNPEYRERKKKQYLEVMLEQGFTKCTVAMRYIKENIDEEGESSFEYAYELLRQAYKAHKDNL